jgi:adenosine deaminase
MSESLETFCLALPKVELHVHLLGAVRPATFAEMAARAGIAGGDANRMAEHRMLRQPADLHRIAYEHLQDTAAQGVRHSEIFWSPTETAHLFPYARGADAILAGFADAATDFGVSAFLIPAISRQDTPETAVQLVEWMLAHRRDAIVGLSITGQPLGLFMDACRLAKQGGFRLTAHASHLHDIEAALSLLEADRIGHGAAVLEDPVLTARCAERGMLFTVVPAASSDLPLRQMLKAGLRIHPNTGTPAPLRTTPTRCWRLMVEDFEFNFRELRGFMLNGIRGSFLPEPSRRHLEASFAEEFDALVAETFPEGSLT